MLITIYDSAGTPKVELSPNDNSTQVKEVQGDSVLTLSFSHYDYIDLDVDDYTDWEGERFWLTEKYRPHQNSRMEWVYDVKLYGIESMIKRLLVIKNIDGEEEPEFTLTAPPAEHVAMIVKCMNNGLGYITDWKLGQVCGTENIVIDYFGKYCDEALKEIAEKVGAEWWVDGETVNVCRCEHGEPISMGYDNGLLSIVPDKADNVKFYTRLYPVGSSRNIDPEKYGHTRLQLPDGKKFVEINADKYGRVDHYEKDAFADIYPRRIGTVSSVRCEEKKGEDGNLFTIYYFKDDSLDFDPNSYEIGGLVKRVSFQEGSELGGLGTEDNGTYFFEVNFNSDTQEFEIITIWPYDDDTQLPGGMLVPNAGDKYILWNLRMPDEYYALAEEEFMSAVEDFNAEHDLDISVYKAPTDHVWIEDNNIELTIGQRIRLESDEYFPETGYRDSRITKITRKVNLPSSMDIEISDALSRTAQEKISDSIADVRSYAKSIEESTSLPDIIRSGDRTKPTDNNLYSARRTILEFTRKAIVERVSALWNFLKGIRIGNYVAGNSGAQIDENGNAEVESLTSRSYLKVFELIYNRIATQEGDTSFSDSGTIDYIYETTNAGITAQLRKRWDGDFTSFQPGDVVYGYVNNLDKASAKEYGKAWARIVSVDRSSNVITLAPYMNAEVPGGVNLSLTESMIITRYGNAIEPSETTAANPNYAPFIKKKNGKWVNTRQSTFFISTDSGNLVELMGVNKPIVTKENMGLVLGKIPEGLLPANIEESLNPEQPYLYARGILVQDLIRIGYEGLQPRTSNYRGQWSAETAASSTEYYRNTTDMFDTVSHNGAMWQNVTVGTTDEPADTSSGWLRMTGTDDQTRGLWQIVPNASQIWIGEDETIYPDVLSVKVHRSSLKGDFEYTDNASLIAAGAKLQYSIDNSSEWHDFSMGTSEHLEVESGLGLTGEAAWFETEASEPFMTEGNNFTNLSDVTNNIRFRLVDIWANPNGGGEFTRVTVPVIRDGSSVAIASTSVKYTGTATSSKPDDSAFTYDWGTPFFAALVNNGWIYTWSRTEVIYTDGKSTVTYARTKNGDKGEKGAMVYPAGVFTSGNTYDGADGACPVVEYEGIYYLLKPGFVYNSTALDDSAYPNPAVAAAANYKWEQFTMFKSVFTEVLMASFANIGSMIFYGDTIFSQDGRLGFIDLDTYDYNTLSYAKRYIDVTGLDGNGKAWYLRLNNEMTETGTLQQIIDNGNYLTNSTLGKFIPNVCINFKTGEVQTNNGLEIGQTNNPDEAAVAIVGHGNIISDGVIGGGVKVYEVVTTDWNSPAASTISLINRTAGSTFGVNLPTLRASLAAMGRKKKSGSGDTAVYDATEPFAYVITYVNTYTSVGNLLITGSGNPGNTMVGEIISTQSRLPALVGSTRDSTTNKPTSTTMKLLPGQTVQILLEYTGTPQSQSYKGTYTAYIL